MKPKSFGNKCKYGHFESEHIVDSSYSSLPKMSELLIYFEPLLQKKSTANRKDCKICDCKQFNSGKIGWVFDQMTNELDSSLDVLRKAIVYFRKQGYSSDKWVWK